MKRSEFAMGAMTFVAVIATGLLSERYLDRHFATVEADNNRTSKTPADAPGHPTSPAACVDEDGSWKNWPWPNVPALSPKCRQDR